MLTRGLTWQQAIIPHNGLHHGSPRFSQLGINIVEKYRFSDLKQVYIIGKIVF